MLMQSLMPAPKGGTAIVTKSGLNPTCPDEYLQLDPVGGQRWVRDAVAATAFPSMRDAMRMASHLPAQTRAFGLPRDIEVSFQTTH